MPVTVDQESLNARELGFGNVGDVLNQLHRCGRLVLRILIDGESPDMKQMATVRATPIDDRVIYIETEDLRKTALDVLSNADTQLREADLLKDEAADLLRTDQWPPFMEKLSQCVGFWQDAQRAVVTVSRFFSIDLDALLVQGRPLSKMLGEFAGQLRDLQSALQAADPVRLTDLLTYEIEESGNSWRLAVDAVRARIDPRSVVQSAA
jgi:hypothetical protein